MAKKQWEPWQVALETGAVQPPPPSITVTSEAPAAVRADLVVIPILTGDDAPLIGPGTDDEALIEAAVDAGLSGRVGESLRVGDVLLVGAGEGTPTELRRAAAVMVRERGAASSIVTTLAALGNDDALTAVVEGIVLARPTFSMRSTTQTPTLTVTLAECAATETVLEQAVAVAHAAALARALATVPSNIKSPAWLASQAVAHGARSGLSVEVWDEAQLAKEGFGGVLAVGSGSATPPRFVTMSYAPPKANRKTPHIVLVGKGITFDTGGLSIKPGDSMGTMKRDMTGAGVVLSVMSALSAIGCQVKVTGLLPIAENAVGGASMRPGDVITHYGGRTSEVTNTDAEGRLVMADALAYAAAKLNPTMLVDIATLTGAAKVALGLHLGAIFATDDALADQFIEAGASAGEPLWRLPLAEVYNELLASKVADADNAAGSPGATTAALFLKPFTGNLPWVHLDIAPVGDSLQDRYEYAKGPTGFGVRLLLRWLSAQ